jgi:hypothetical protein
MLLNTAVPQHNRISLFLLYRSSLLVLPVMVQLPFTSLASTVQATLDHIPSSTCQSCHQEIYKVVVQFHACQQYCQSPTFRNISSIGKPLPIFVYRTVGLRAKLSTPCPFSSVRGRQKRARRKEVQVPRQSPNESISQARFFNS